MSPSRTIPKNNASTSPSICSPTKELSTSQESSNFITLKWSAQKDKSCPSPLLNVSTLRPSARSKSTKFLDSLPLRTFPTTVRALSREKCPIVTKICSMWMYLLVHAVLSTADPSNRGHSINFLSMITPERSGRTGIQKARADTCPKQYTRNQESPLKKSAIQPITLSSLVTFKWTLHQLDARNSCKPRSTSKVTKS